MIGSDDMMVTLKVLIPEDAEELLRLQHQLDQESKFMLLEPDERQSSLNQVKEMIESFALANTSILIGTEVDMTHNELAMSLYIKNGFEIEGTKRKSLVIDGQWIDEYYMSKILIKEKRIEDQI
ncbi:MULTISPECIES: hypothetical protein [unclassified Paenibacillus]